MNDVTKRILHSVFISVYPVCHSVFFFSMGFWPVFFYVGEESDVI